MSNETEKEKEILKKCLIDFKHHNQQATISLLAEITERTTEEIEAYLNDSKRFPTFRDLWCIRLFSMKANFKLTRDSYRVINRPSSRLSRLAKKHALPAGNSELIGEPLRKNGTKYLFNNDLLSVKEIALAAGVSGSAVYLKITQMKIENWGSVDDCIKRIGKKGRPKLSD